MLNLHARKIVGWAMASATPAALVALNLSVSHAAGACIHRNLVMAGLGQKRTQADDRFPPGRFIIHHTLSNF